MRYYLDTEFNGFGGSLISIALAPEDDVRTPFYGAVPCLDPIPWVKAHVLPALDLAPVPYTELRRAFAHYLSADPEPVIIADWPEDIVHAARLLATDDGRRLIIAPVRFEIVAAGDFSTSQHSLVPHNALYDAMALRDHLQELSTLSAD